MLHRADGRLDLARPSPRRHHDRQVALDGGEARQRLRTSPPGGRAPSAVSESSATKTGAGRSNASRTPSATSPNQPSSSGPRGEPRRRGPARDTRAPARRARRRRLRVGQRPRRAGPARPAPWRRRRPRDRARREPGAGRAQAGQRDAEPQLLVRGAIAVLGPMRREELADLEDPRVRRLPVRVDRQHLEEPGDERRAQHRALDRRRVLQRDQRRGIVPAHALEPVGIDEG